MFESALEVAQNLAVSHTSKYDNLFTPEEKAKLEEWVSWLISLGFKKTSASSYRANFSRATAKKYNNLSSDERSALRKFNEFMAS